MGKFGTISHYFLFVNIVKIHHDEMRKTCANAAEQYNRINVLWDWNIF